MLSLWVACKDWMNGFRLEPLERNDTYEVVEREWEGEKRNKRAGWRFTTSETLHNYSVYQAVSSAVDHIHIPPSTKLMVINEVSARRSKQNSRLLQSWVTWKSASVQGRWQLSLDKSFHKERWKLSSSPALICYQKIRLNAFCHFITPSLPRALFSRATTLIKNSFPMKLTFISLCVSEERNIPNAGQFMRKHFFSEPWWRVATSLKLELWMKERDLLGEALT